MPEILFTAGVLLFILEFFCRIFLKSQQVPGHTRDTPPPPAGNRPGMIYANEL